MVRRAASASDCPFILTPFLILGVELEDVEDSLRVPCVVLLRDGRRGEKASPLFGQSGEGPRNWIEADVNLVDEVRRSARTQGRVVVDVVHPSVQLFVVLERLCFAMER